MEPNPPQPWSSFWACENTLYTGAVVMDLLGVLIQRVGDPWWDQFIRYMKKGSPPTKVYIGSFVKVLLRETSPWKCLYGTVTLTPPGA